MTFLTSSGGTSGNLFYPTPKLYIDASYSFKSYFAFKTYAFKLWFLNSWEKNSNMSNELNRRTEEPQRVDSSRADAEWKADSGLGNLVHGANGQVSSSHLRLATSNYWYFLRILKWIAQPKQPYFQMEILKIIPQVVTEVEESKGGLVMGKDHQTRKNGCRREGKMRELNEWGFAVSFVSWDSCHFTPDKYLRLYSKSSC